MICVWYTSNNCDIFFSFRGFFLSLFSNRTGSDRTFGIFTCSVLRVNSVTWCVEQNPYDSVLWLLRNHWTHQHVMNTYIAITLYLLGVSNDLWLTTENKAYHFTHFKECEIERPLSVYQIQAFFPSISCLPFWFGKFYYDIVWTTPLLMMLFRLLSIALYIKYRQTHKPRPKKVYTQ